MFRNPRENASIVPGTAVQPSVGRPPSPPTTPRRKPSTAAPAPPSTRSQMATRAMPGRTSSTSKTAATPTIGRGSTNPRKSALTNSKARAKPNASILSFFKKDDGLFVADSGTLGNSAESDGPLQDGGLLADWEAAEIISHESEEETRYNEEGGAVKKRRLDVGSAATPPDTAVVKQEAAPDVTACSPPPPEEPTSGISASAGLKSSGPFVEESDSEDDETATELVSKGEVLETVQEPTQTVKETEPDPDQEKSSVPERPQLPHEATSMSTAVAEGFGDFEGADEFEDDVYDEGEEFLERRWMEEQRRLEMAEAGDEDESFEGEDGANSPAATVKQEPQEPTAAAVEAASCPMCNVSLDGVAEQDAAVHVNNCLDGNPTPLPAKKSSPSSAQVSADKGASGAARFRRPPRPAKPGQEDPFALGNSSNGGSAFSKLMSGHAEDAAWASAAAAENASRGKPAYQRTCPFYKILPGFNICVDAFRYGAVEGCRAYFLSHFHSDHYIGLTASWCHGPIYCSHVTANLVRQQLRVDPKWVVDLDFETKFEVPGTSGVNVTMISANHCPGSSLYLFEKTTGKGPNPKLQRVLHCGDFRACPAHVEHSLLRPDVVDIATGKERQQKLDVCYLDTTYLNPKYAFPSQEDVIKACADMCVSLNRVQTDESDGWEQMKRERAGAGMVKFVQKDSEPAIKEEESEDMKVMTNGKLGSSKGRGRLLVVVGTYSIGKERVCLGIARALNSKIYAPAGKQRICAALEDAELNARLTTNPREAQVHMTPLFEIRADTLDDYLKDYVDCFSRCVGFRPSGWNYRPPNSRFVESPSVSTVLHSANWNSSYSMKELVPQRGSTSRASCFGVPYSEHSSFRELTMFCCALRIDKIIPTVNIGSAKSRERMKAWCERWAMERKKNGLFRLGQGTSW
ncbi:hypothetical protein MBLNU459_g7641t1 [Dothideomycetes sp. NU459]